MKIMTSVATAVVTTITINTPAHDLILKLNIQIFSAEKHLKTQTPDRDESSGI